MDRGSPYRVRFLRTPAVSSEGVSRWLCRSLNVPCDRGPDGKYDLDSMVEKNRRESSKCNPVAQPPDENAPLAPLRDDVALIDPCSGQLSAAARMHLASKIRTPFTDRVYPPSDLWVPPGVRDRPQTPPMRPSALRYEESDHKRWNSRLKLGGKKQVLLSTVAEAKLIYCMTLLCSDIHLVFLSALFFRAGKCAHHSGQQ